MLDLKDTFNNYVSILEDLGAENLVASYTAQKLEEKLKLHFKERIIIHKGKYKRGSSLILNSNITLEEVLKLADLQKSKLDELIQDVAFILRATIKAQPAQVSLQVELCFMTLSMEDQLSSSPILLLVQIIGLMNLQAV